MKKILVSLASICLAIPLFAQIPADFVLNSDGVLVSQSTDKQYIVAEYPGIPKNELYTKIYLSLIKNFGLEEKEINKIQDEFISFSGELKEAVPSPYKGLLAKGSSHLTYDCEILFKEGRIRIDLKNLKVKKYNSSSQIYEYTNLDKYAHLWFSMEKDKKNDYRMSTKKVIEDNLNNLVNKITIEMDTQKEENW